jgi:NADH-quinone oxidoreductase subunit M
VHRRAVRPAHSRQIADYGGVVNKMPKFAAFFILFSMANCGLPATSGFVGEFMVILGATQYNFWIGLLAATALIFGAAYSLWMAKRVIFGKVTNHHVAELVDLNGREFFMLGIWRRHAVHGPVPSHSPTRCKPRSLTCWRTSHTASCLK